MKETDLKKYEKKLIQFERKIGKKYDNIQNVVDILDKRLNYLLKKGKMTSKNIKEIVDISKVINYEWDEKKYKTIMNRFLRYMSNSKRTIKELKECQEMSKLLLKIKTKLCYYS